MLPIEAPQLVSGSFYIYVVRTVCLNKKVHSIHTVLNIYLNPADNTVTAALEERIISVFKESFYTSFSSLRVDGDGTDISVTQRCEHVSDPSDNSDSAF